MTKTENLYLVSNVAYFAPANPSDLRHGVGPTDRRADTSGNGSGAFRIIQLVSTRSGRNDFPVYRVQTSNRPCNLNQREKINETSRRSFHYRGAPQPAGLYRHVRNQGDGRLSRERRASSQPSWRFSSSWRNSARGNAGAEKELPPEAVCFQTRYLVLLPSWEPRAPSEQPPPSAAGKLGETVLSMLLRLSPPPHPHPRGPESVRSEAWPHRRPPDVEINP